MGCCWANERLVVPKKDGTQQKLWKEPSVVQDEEEEEALNREEVVHGSVCWTFFKLGIPLSLPYPNYYPPIKQKQKTSQKTVSCVWMEEGKAVWLAVQQWEILISATLMGVVLYPCKCYSSVLNWNLPENLKETLTNTGRSYKLVVVTLSSKHCGQYAIIVTCTSFRYSTRNTREFILFFFLPYRHTLLGCYFRFLVVLSRQCKILK